MHFYGTVEGQSPNARMFCLLFGGFSLKSFGELMVVNGELESDSISE